MHARNAIVIPSDKPHNILPYHRVFIVGNSVNATDMQPDPREQRLPSRDGMGANDGMMWGKLKVDVKR